MKLRLATLTAAAAFLLTAGVAQATVTSSNITAPANNAYLESNDNPPSPTMLTVTGTSNGTTGDHVDIYCFYDDGARNEFDAGVAVQADGSFSDTAPLRPLAGYACRLRALPAGSSSEDAHFSGPRIAVSQFGTTAYGYTVTNGPNDGALYDYYANGTTFGSYVGWDSAGSCGAYGFTLDASYAQSRYAIDCMGALDYRDGISRSEIQVDGHNAYDPRAAYELFCRSGGCSSTTTPFDGSQDNAGFPALTVSQSWNSSNGLESTTETDGIVACAGADGYLPPNQGACPSFQASGVQLQRAISMIGPDQIMMTDTWSSTDGHAHTVDAEYDDDTESQGSGAAYQFPGETGFSRHGVGDVIGGASSAPGSILIHTDASAIDGDPDQSYGAITFSTAPSGFEFGFNSHDFFEHQALSVPASGSATLSYIYSLGTTSEQVRALALAAQDRFHSPAVSITSPANNTKVKTGNVTVTGSASSGSGISSLTVGGHAVSVGSSGAWSTSVALSKGANTITATATDNAGQSASAHITVIYAKQCVVPHLKGLGASKAEKRIRAAGCLVGKVKKRHSKVKKGHAIKTKPHAGKSVAAGTKVTLYVSEGR